MFNIRLRNLFIVIFLLISLILTCGCSSKPSEKIVKDFVDSQQRACSAQKDVLTCDDYEKFEIVNDFHKKIDDENWYCLEVNYKYHWKIINPQADSTVSPEGNVIGDQEQYCFVKRGKDWYGVKGWPN